MFVIEVVHMQCSRLVKKDLEYAVLSMVMCTIKNPTTSARMFYGGWHLRDKWHTDKKGEPW